MKIFETKKTSIQNVIACIQKNSSISDGAVSKQSREKTKSLFGKPLTPPQVVDHILSDIRRRGDRALMHYNHVLDNARLTTKTLRVSSRELSHALRITPKPIIATIRRVIKNIERFQKHIRYTPPGALSHNGIRCALNVRPIESVGAYIPGGIGGETPLVSTVLMNTIPARTAGVKRIVMVSPPRKDGTIHPTLLAAASLCNVDEIYKVGGVQAVGALAYGTATIQPVNKIIGPGNIFVSLAKRSVFGHVDIDFFAGPSEVLIIADHHANPDSIALDLFSQAEHYPGSAILVTPSARLLNAVTAAIQTQLPNMKRSRQIQEMFDKFCFLIKTTSMKEAIAVSNTLAPEHLQIMTHDNQSVLKMITNAGAIFVGPMTPVAVGDYFAGPSHVLPTNSTARFFSGLTVNDFIKTSSVIQFSHNALKRSAPDIIRLAEIEGLHAHAASVASRIQK